MLWMWIQNQSLEITVLNVTTVKKCIFYLTELFLHVLMLNIVCSWHILMYLVDSDLKTNMMLTWINISCMKDLNIVKYAKKWTLNDILSYSHYLKSV